MTKRLLIASRVIADDWPSSTIRQLTFQPIHRPTFPRSVAGDHVQVQHQNGIRRDYSLLEASEGATFTVAVRRDDFGRGGSVVFHDELLVGDLIFVSYPQPGMRLGGTSRHLFIAGGIGVTAVLPLLRALGQEAEAEVHYCVRDHRDAAYIDRLAATGAELTVHESSTTGRLDPAGLLSDVRPDTSLYFCGPASLMTAVAEASGHWPSERVHSETFIAAPAAGERLGDPFRARLLLSQKEVAVGEDESLLQAMQRENVPLEYSCEGGICGSCVLDLVDGGVDHRDRCLSEAERQTSLTACVSRGQGTIAVNA